MTNYLLAEHLKHKRSFVKKLVVIAPLVAVLYAFFIMPYYFASNAYNWWYIVLMPATLSLIPALMNRREDGKLKYRAVFPLAIDLKKYWVSKVIVGVIYMSVAVAIHMAGVVILQPLVGNSVDIRYVPGTLALASALLVTVNLWQIPLCLFLAKKIGLIASVVGNTAVGIVLAIMFADGSHWLLCPYAWGARLMIPVLKILPSGVMMEAGDGLATNTMVAAPCILSLVLFVILTFVTANRLSTLEVSS